VVQSYSNIKIPPKIFFVTQYSSSVSSTRMSAKKYKKIEFAKKLCFDTRFVLLPSMPQELLP
jgi:hypothetical protein